MCPQVCLCISEIFSWVSEWEISKMGDPGCAVMCWVWLIDWLDLCRGYRSVTHVIVVWTWSVWDSKDNYVYQYVTLNAANHIEPLYHSSLHDRSKWHKTFLWTLWMKNNIWLKSGLFLDLWWYLRWRHCCSFGITPTLEKVHHDGTMYTKVDDCQFVCVPQEDYCRILHEVKHNVLFCLLLHILCGKRAEERL